VKDVSDFVDQHIFTVFQPRLHANTIDKIVLHGKVDYDEDEYRESDGFDYLSRHM
jgi:hypothetical protein